MAEPAEKLDEESAGDVIAEGSQAYDYGQDPMSVEMADFELMGRAELVAFAAEWGISVPTGPTAAIRQVVCEFFDGVLPEGDEDP